ncbi:MULTISPECIES: S8 family serine peptidase [unclassified Bacillus (in: firmicutes)]|uniref:S8 family peptidase n=1 Tax=unclassified Bacillus (in: firmicutes) TaxID=185979 RepID=UPI0008E5C7B6|nr:MULTISPECIES: S8 family serine peptidase [unclassified Bacillus (in: firmicutes)]SFA70801.1 serine protease AprX [Bacillus sp. UNCCL13]SFQ60775.1 serine protease AprX [Bacillus sp. cl95]
MNKISRIIVSFVLIIGFIFSFSISQPKAVIDQPEIDPKLKELLANPITTGKIDAVITYQEMPSLSDIQLLQSIGFKTKKFNSLPMVAISGNVLLFEKLLNLTDGILSIYLNDNLMYYLRDSRQLIGAEAVWNDLGYTGKGVTVAVIDSGIDATHQDLQFGEKVIQNVKFLTGNSLFGSESLFLENVPNTDTTSGHGTHVAGTIAGNGTASAGLYKGVAPDAKLVGLGVGEGINILWSLEAFDYVLEHQEEYGIDVISNSWGSTGEYSPNHPINVASKKAHDAGMTVVFAAGNEGPEDNTLNPYSAPPWVISVAAGTKDKKLADFSSRGVEGDEFLHPDITAPGVDIVATRSSTGLVMNALGTATDATYIDPIHLPYYTTSSGTSMATPHISGVIALMKEAQQALTPDMALDLLINTADPMADYKLHEVGAGYINAYKAVEQAANSRIKIAGYTDKKTGKKYDTYTTQHTWEGSVGTGLADAGVASHDYYGIDIEKGIVSLKVRIEWTLPANDLDLEVRDSEGKLAGSSGNGVTSYEETLIPSPIYGQYKIDVIGYLNTVENYKGIYTVERILK